MKKSLTTILIAIFILNSTILHAKKSAGYKISCRSVIFSNSTKKKRLYSKGENNRVLPASTVKVMTALIVLEKLSLDKYVRVNQSATYVQPSKLYLKPGEEYKVEDLLYAILLSSANDASVVLAQAVAGSEQNFVNLMNAKARRLGAKHTKFANSNGLPSKATQYTTAYDMYLIFREALKKPFFRNAIKKQYATIYSKSGRQIGLASHNKMLFKGWRKHIYGKTGWTRKAGGCFIGMVEKNGDDLIIGVFGCSSKRWNDIKYITTKYGGIRL